MRFTSANLFDHKKIMCSLIIVVLCFHLHMCTRGDIVLSVYNQSPYPDSKNQLRFLVIKILDDDSKHF